MKKQRPPQTVAIEYDAEAQEIQIYMINRDILAAEKTKALVLPMPLKKSNFALGDEFARQLGLLALMWLALGQPDLNQYVTASRNTFPVPD